MAIRNATAAVAGLSLATGLESITDFTLTGLFKTDQNHASGEMPMIEFTASGKSLEIRTDYQAFTLSKNSSPGSWEQLTDAPWVFGDWVGVGISCSGVGAGLLTICVSTEAGVYTEILRELGGTTWTPTLIRLLHGGVISTRGMYGDVMNVKYGQGALTAAKMADECWNLAVQHTGDWTPLETPMSSGNLATQAGTLTVVNSGSLAVSVGPLAESTGTPPTVTVTTVTPSSDDVTVEGTFTSAGGGAFVTLDLLLGSAPAYTILAGINGLAWSATFTDIAPGAYTIRARVVDGSGNATDDDSVLFVGLSGEDSIPYTYSNTAILGVPSTASIPVGSTATFKAVNQSGAPIAGAVVAVGNSSIATAPNLTDDSGNVVVTGVAEGNTNLVLSVMNQAGSFLNAQVPLTITAASGSDVTVTPGVATIAVNQTQQFTGVVSGGGAITWTVESGGGSIDSNGLYTAPSTATTAVIRGAKTGELTTFDESTVTVTAEAQSGIGAQFLGNANVAVAPGQSFSWRIKVEVDSQAFQGAVITPTASPNDLLSITQPLATAADGTTTITVQVASDIDTGIEAEVTFAIVAGDLSMQLTATVSITESEFGYLVLRGRSYPRPYKQN